MCDVRNDIRSPGVGWQNRFRGSWLVAAVLVGTLEGPLGVRRGEMPGTCPYILLQPEG